VWGQVGNSFTVLDDDGGKREVKFLMSINYSGVLSSKFMGIAEGNIQCILKDKNNNIIKKYEIEHLKFRSLISKDMEINGNKNISIIVEIQESHEYVIYIKFIAKTTNWYNDLKFFEFSTSSKVDFGENNHYVKYDYINVYLK
jgi:hypothetical protein